MSPIDIFRGLLDGSIETDEDEGEEDGVCHDDQDDGNASPLHFDDMFDTLEGRAVGESRYAAGV